MENFENSYLTNSIEFNYLKNCYNSLDIAKEFGVSNLEIKHSNFLRFFLQPRSEDVLDYFPIKQLLKVIQNNITSDEYSKFKNIDIESSSIKNVNVAREKYNIDFVITLDIENESYVIAIENKIEASEGEDQLSRYRNTINDKYPDVNKLFVLLHPNYEQLKLVDKKELLRHSAERNNYISITYQDIYDIVLNKYLKITNNSEIKFILHAYIHTLSCYSSNNFFGLIVEENEKEALEKLFNDKNFIETIENINKNIELYKENRETLLKICDKYKLLKKYEIPDEISKAINMLEKQKIYKFDGVQPKYIYEFAYMILSNIVKENNITKLDDFGEELKEYVFGKSWYLHEWEIGLADVFGGIITDYEKYPPIIINNVCYYSSKAISYISLIELCNLIINRFPQYKERIELL